MRINHTSQTIMYPCTRFSNYLQATLKCGCVAKKKSLNTVEMSVFLSHNNNFYTKCGQPTFKKGQFF